MRKILLFITLLPLGYVFGENDTSLLTLETLLKQVETHYPSVLQHRSNIRSLEAKADGSKAWMPPTFSAGFMRFPYRMSMLADQNNPMNQAGIALSFEQMIPNPGKLTARQSYINSLIEIEKSKSEWTINTLRREAKILYFSRYVSEKKYAILKQSEEILQLLIAGSEENFSNRQSQMQAIYKAKARLAELNNMMLMTQSAVAESNIGLNSLLMRDVNTRFRIDTLLKTGQYTAFSADTGALAERSDIQTLMNSIRSMKLEQRVMELGVRPDFGIRAEHMQMFGMPNQWSVMGMVTLPIVPWASGMYTAEARAVGMQVQAMEQEKQTMLQMASRMLSEKLSMIRYENALYQSYTENIIPAYESSLQASLLAYRENTGDLFVLLDAWEMLLMKKLEAQDKLFNVLKLEAEYAYETETK